MCTLDIILLALLIPSLIQGLRKGFIEQAADLAALVLGIWAGYHFTSIVSIHLENVFPGISSPVLNVLSFIIITLVAFAILTLLGKMLKKVIHLALLGWVDRLLGVVLALTKAVLILGVLIILFDTINGMTGWVKEESIAQSVVYPVMRKAAYTVFPYLKALIFKQA